MGKVALLITFEVDHENKSVHASISKMEAPEPKKKLEFFYKNIECDIVEVVGTSRGDIWLNEEGLYKPNNPVNKFTVDGQEYQIVGNMIISKDIGDEGEMLWFDSEQDKELLHYWEFEVLPAMSTFAITSF